MRGFIYTEHKCINIRARARTHIYIYIYDSLMQIGNNESKGFGPTFCINGTESKCKALIMMVVGVGLGLGFEKAKAGMMQELYEVFSVKL